MIKEDGLLDSVQKREEVEDEDEGEEVEPEGKERYNNTRASQRTRDRPTRGQTTCSRRDLRRFSAKMTSSALECARQRLLSIT